MRVNAAQVREGLEELADANFQKTAWRGLDPGIVASFVECVATIFDDSGLADEFDEARGVVFSISLDSTLRQLRAAVQMVSQDQEIDETLGTHNSIGAEDSRGLPSTRCRRRPPGQHPLFHAAIREIEHVF